MEYLRLYLDFYRIKLKSIAQYRGAFFMTSFSKAFSYAARIVTIAIMIDAFQTIGTWKAHEVMMLFGLNSASYAIAGAFFYHLATGLSNWVKDGTIDEILTKPLNPFLYLASRLFSTGYFGTLGISAVIIAWSLWTANIPVTLGKLTFLIVSIVSGGLISGSILIITSVPSFWIIESSALRHILFNSMSDFAEYPLSIFNKLIQVFLTVVIPFGFVTFFPALAILEKQDYTMFPIWFSYISPVVAIILFAIAYRFWCYGLTKYNSSGS